MTIRIVVLCDARGCAREAQIDADRDYEVERAGFKFDPLTDGQHYCPKCWPAVKREMDKDSAP